MALISLAVITVAVAVYVILKKVESLRKDKAFASASKLPGPKGSYYTPCLCNRIGSPSYRSTYHWQCPRAPREM